MLNRHACDVERRLTTAGRGALLALAAMLAAGCDTASSDRAAEQERIAKIEKHLQEQTTASLNTSPSGDSPNAETPSSRQASAVQYRIVKEDNLLAIKRQLWVLLPHTVSFEQLRAIATELKSRETKTYERTFMVYHLSGMDPDGLAWATTHFDPHLEVRILGLTSEQERRLSVVEAVDGDVMGSWLHEQEPLCPQLTILRRGKQFFLRRVCKDGSSGEEGLVEKRSSRGRRFEYAPDPGHGEYFLITNDGQLQEWDPDGLLFTARRLK